jgi:hypothetical protein
MAHYFFVKDLKDGNLAEEVVAEHYRAKAYNVETLSRKRQNEGDIEVFRKNEVPFTVEVKFDRMAKDTGNLCFEITNKKGDLTGIAKTTADIVVYIVPKDEQSVRLFTFETKVLKAYLYDTLNKEKVRQVKGGDRRAFTLMLVSIENIIADKVGCVEEINAQLPV